MKTPVLLIGFNRPEPTRRVVDSLVSAGAENVYIAVDGPRTDNPQDVEQVSQVKEVIDRAAWRGAVTRFYRQENLGCRRGVSAAIDWFFDHEEEGIILEDDCVPDASFFPFATELLEKYRDNQKIGMISGSTFFPFPARESESYTFSRYPHIWGWATWRRAWKHYDSELGTWFEADAKTVLENVSGGSEDYVAFWAELLTDVATGKIDTWDYIWSYSFWRAGFVSISPAVNLIENIGFTALATHTTRRPLVKAFRPPSTAIDFPLVHPNQVSANHHLERLTRELAMGVRGKNMRSVLRIAWMLRRLGNFWS